MIHKKCFIKLLYTTVLYSILYQYIIASKYSKQNYKKRLRIKYYVFLNTFLAGGNLIIIYYYYCADSIYFCIVLTSLIRHYSYCNELSLIKMLVKPHLPSSRPNCAKSVSRVSKSLYLAFRPRKQCLLGTGQLSLCGHMECFFRCRYTVCGQKA